MYEVGTSNVISRRGVWKVALEGEYDGHFELIKGEKQICRGCDIHVSPY